MYFMRATSLLAVGYLVLPSLNKGFIIIIIVLKDLLEFTMKKSGQYYDQIDDAAMGSPLGHSLANIFMCHF